MTFSGLTSDEDIHVSDIVKQPLEAAYPSEEDDPGLSRRDLSLAPALVLLIAARNFCNGSSLEKPVILGFVTTWISELR